MESTYFEEQQFDKIDYTEKPLVKGEYEYCSFNNCNFSNSDLGNIDFSDCTFIGCNLSMAKLVQTGLKNIKFKDCKLLGLHFENCSPFLFEVSFDNCLLNLSSFYKMKISKTKFKDSTMHDVDFSEATASSALFDNCDLHNAFFANSILEKADLRTAYNYSINPETNSIKKAKFSMAGVTGLLNQYDIVIE